MLSCDDTKLVFDNIDHISEYSVNVQLESPEVIISYQISYQSFMYNELQSIGHHSEIGFKIVGQAILKIVGQAILKFKIVRKLKILFQSNTQSSARARLVRAN